ncbi:unnamed protein product [Phytophthora fragariaefolia]|uniref:Unnamed protein product n=1 Tax=Phytophthora fragariaefolia TaxID=1490495 RepID=A0A9W6YML7_9STRA|nr:unnamed protein product [Phytophthora fragariaefolia]
MEFQSVNKPGLCLDDGGGWGAGDSTAHLWECDPGNMNQWFVTNPDTMMFHNPAKPGLCFDDTGATEAGKSNFIMWYCNPDTPNQQFEVVPQWELLGTVPDVAPPPLPKIDDGPWTVIDNGDDVLPPPPSDVPPPVIVDNNDDVVGPSPPSSGSGVLMPPDMIQPIGQDTAYNPPVTSVDNGGITMPPTDTIPPVGEDSPYNPGLEDSGFVQHTESTAALENTPTISSGLSQGGDSGPTQTTSTDSTPAPAMDTNVQPVNLDPLEPIGPEVLPDREDDTMLIPKAPVIKRADMPLAEYGGADWNLLAPSNDTIAVINADNSTAISAAKIFQYLQSLKDHADVEHDVTLYRYKRTFQCVSEGLKTLAKDAVSSDEYHVLVSWM